jgi:peptidase E
MPKYILHGGNTSTPNDLNSNFFKEITNELKNGDTILIVYFARKKEDYQKCFEQEKNNFLKAAPEKEFNLIVADEKNFIKQLKQAQTVYIRGGETLLLINTLKNYPEFIELLAETKVVAGSSAGAYALARYYYSHSQNTVLEGLGVVPVAIRCHFKGEGDIREELIKVAKGLKVVLLDDCEFEIIKTDTLINIFDEIRDIPYKISLSLDEIDTSCTGKHFKLIEEFNKLGYETRWRVCEFNWKDIGLPVEILKIPHQEAATHAYIEVKINNKWTIVDCTWDNGLKKILPVNSWDCISDTQIAVPYTDIYDVEKSNTIMTSYDDKEILADLSINAEFYRAINNWFEDIRNNNKNEQLPKIIKDVGFDFNWDIKKVWALDIPITKMAISELTWHFNIPFLWENDGFYNLKPQEVIDNPKGHKQEYERTIASDLKYPIDIMENKGRWLILDGLHRLMKANIQGLNEVNVRIIPRDEIPAIIK